jgi:hypothetical protein
MRSSRNVLSVIVLGALVVAGSLWAGDNASIPVIRKGQQAQQSVSQAIIDVIDHYHSTDRENAYHAKINDPSVPWQEKCQLAIDHGRLQLLTSDLGGSLGGTRERATSVLWVHVLCPEEVAVLEIPADFVVDTAPHPEELQAMSFDTDMNAIEGKATDSTIFSVFHLVGGTANGYPSPGHTSLIPAEDGSFGVDSTFSIGYRIEFEGAKGGPLEGAAGKVESSILMKAVGK